MKHYSTIHLFHTLFLSLVILALTIKDSKAVSAKDILIIYNSSVPDSKEVASYYAKKRGVPKANLIQVNVTASEAIHRLEFKQKMLPSIRASINRLKGSERNPVILLVYGIPLRITGQPMQKPDDELIKLAETKLKECRNLIAQMSKQLEWAVNPRSQDDSNRAAGKAQSSEDLLKNVGQAISKAVTYLNNKEHKDKNTDKKTRASSLLIRLTGFSPTVRSIKNRLLSSPKKESILMQNLTILKWDAIFNREKTDITFGGVLPDNALVKASIIRLSDGITGELRFWETVKEIYSKNWTSASVDSELTLILQNHQISGWSPNPFLKRYDEFLDIKRIRQQTVMVSRLDGPNPKQVKRMIDDAIQVESSSSGLKGVFYIDTRWTQHDKENRNSYVWYDKRLANLFDILTKHSSMKVVIDKKPELFPPGTCPEAALYCGWYSLAKYIDSFTWQKGAVGFHIASSEASTLRKKGSSVWCKRMIEKGVAATLGPVEEPYLSSFPLPDAFFPLLMTGKHPLVEVYYRTTPYLSWRQVLIGDPLYTPFKNNPAIKLPEPLPNNKKAEGK
jgi:uncharacterized protein (TIGR03790 family)